MTTKNNENQIDIFGAFGLYDEVAEKQKQMEQQKKDEAEAKKAELQAKLEEFKQKTQSSKTDGKAKNESPTVFDVTESTLINYYGQNLPLTDYFDAEEIAEGILVKEKGESVRKKFDGEKIRARMEKNFPNLVKEFTEVVFIEKQNLLVILQKAKKKGLNQEAESYDSVSSISVRQKIPFQILAEFIKLAKEFAEHDLEVHGDIYFDPRSETFVLDIPEQTVHELYCYVTEDSLSLVQRIMGFEKVAEIHSHHDMFPIPSQQDNTSERLPGITYIIVGKVNSYFPLITAREFISDKAGHESIEINDIFECLTDKVNYPISYSVDKIEIGGNER